MKKCITFRFVKGGNPGDGVKTPMGPRDSDSLLHSLSSGLWTPTFDSLECPFLFLLSFLSGHSETPAGDRRRFFIHKFIKLSRKNRKKFPMCTANKLINRN